MKNHKEKCYNCTRCGKDCTATDLSNRTAPQRRRNEQPYCRRCAEIVDLTDRALLIMDVQQEVKKQRPETTDYDAMAVTCAAVNETTGSPEL